jgi:esterase
MMKLHFRALGSGTPLVILHGLLGSLDNWMPIAQILAAHFHVHLLDLRNHGQSPHADEFNYDLMAADVRQFVDEHGLGSTHLLGHSMGAKVAMRFAQLYPESVRKLVVVDMSPRAYPPRYETLLDAMHAVDLSQFQRREQVDEALRAAIADSSVRQFILKNLGRDTLGALVWKPNLASIRANYAQVRKELPATSSECPALFIRGGKSDYIRNEDLPLIRALFPQSVVEEIGGAGHWVNADAPEELANRLTHFLREP